MIFYEAEDFEIYEYGRRIGRFIVQSVEPYEVDIEAELRKDMCASVTIGRLLESGIISYYDPNYTVEISMFDDEITISDRSPSLAKLTPEEYGDV